MGAERDGAADRVVSEVAKPLVSPGLVTRNCTPERDQLLHRADHLARWIVETPEFESCMVNGSAGLVYSPCPYDDRQTAAAGVRAARFRNRLEIFCSDLPANIAGQTRGAYYGHSGVERIEFANWFLDTIEDSLSGIADITALWAHERMHEHGFTHCSPKPFPLVDMTSVAQLCVSYMAKTIAGTRLTQSGWTGHNHTIRENLINQAIAIRGVSNADDLDLAILKVSVPPRLLVAEHSSKCIGVTSTGGDEVSQSTCVPGAPNQRWIALGFPSTGPFFPMLEFFLMNQDGRCLDRPFGDVKNHTPLQLYKCHGGPSQRFFVHPNNQWEAVDNSGLPSGQCLDIPSASLANNVGLQMSECKRSDVANQTFTLSFNYPAPERQPPIMTVEEAPGKVDFLGLFQTEKPLE